MVKQLVGCFAFTLSLIGIAVFSGCQQGSIGQDVTLSAAQLQQIKILIMNEVVPLLHLAERDQVTQILIDKMNAIEAKENQK